MLEERKTENTERDTEIGSFYFRNSKNLRERERARGRKTRKI